MKKRYPVKTKGSLVENMRLVLPVIFDDFMSYKDTVVNHPRLKNKLHEMRIAGKPMRYIMEIMLPFCTKQFEECYDEIKYVLELTGDIHDCDVFVPELLNYLKELRLFNKSMAAAADRFSTKSTRILIKNLREKRKSMFSELCGIIAKWNKERFRDKIIHSLVLLK